MTVRHRCYTPRQNTTDRTCWRTCDPVKTPKKRPRRLKNVCLNLSPKQLDVHFLVFGFVFSPRSDEWTVADSALADYSSQLFLIGFLAVFKNTSRSYFKPNSKGKNEKYFALKKKEQYPTMQCTYSVSKLKISMPTASFWLDSQKTTHNMKIKIVNE